MTEFSHDLQSGFIPREAKVNSVSSFIQPSEGPPHGAHPSGARVEGACSLYFAAAREATMVVFYTTPQVPTSQQHQQQRACQSTAKAKEGQRADRNGGKGGRAGKRIHQDPNTVQTPAGCTPPQSLQASSGGRKAMTSSFLQQDRGTPPASLASEVG